MNRAAVAHHLLYRLLPTATNTSTISAWSEQPIRTTSSSFQSRAATGSFDGEVRVWNVADGAQVVSFRAAPGYPPATAAK